MSKQVRVRFAPSPTGALHIGGVRTALFNYLFAKKNNGVFYLRIEDTDQNRYIEGAEKYILDALKWLTIYPDETVNHNEKFGPYRQSERKEIYKKYAAELIESGNAYYAFDTSEALDSLRKQHEAEGKTFIYNHTIREKLDTSLQQSQHETAKRIADGDEYVIRFKTPVDETLHLKDIIRGDIKFETSLLDDKVLFKSDGMPTYHLANIVDDHLMETSHVIRGEEWLPSMPLHVMLYRSFGWEAPEFAHLPLILKPSGKGKLSKRDGELGGFPVFPLEWNKLKGFKEEGYIPEALLNMLVMLGWNEGLGIEKEVYSLEELCKVFTLENVTLSSGKFSPDKAKWFNQQYIQLQKNSDLAIVFKIILDEKGYKCKIETVEKIISLIKERAIFTTDFWELSKYIFEAPQVFDSKAIEKNWKENTSRIMNNLITIIDSVDNFISSEIEKIVKNWITNENLGFGQVMPAFRISLVGELKGIDLFILSELIGKEETKKRILNSINYNYNL